MIGLGGGGGRDTLHCVQNQSSSEVNNLNVIGILSDRCG